jgi:hypothetical protein
MFFLFFGIYAILLLRHFHSTPPGRGAPKESTRDRSVSPLPVGGSQSPPGQTARISPPAHSGVGAGRPVATAPGEAASPIAAAALDAEQVFDS